MSNPHDLDPGNTLAVVGYAGRFPGAADAAAFWNNLRQGIASVTTFSEEEVLAAGADPELVARKRYVRAGAVLDDVDRFDAGLFGFTAREARLLDPQHRHFLECGWAALEHAGIDPAQGDHAIGVFAGSFFNGYLLGHLASRPEVLKDAGWLVTRILNDKDFLATRLSYLLDLRGPSLSVQTACSTSLVATHLACQSLLSFDCDVALAGGVAIQVPQRLGYLYEEGGIFSPDGICRAFDANARGTVGGSGVGLVVLKRLEDAQTDGDVIHALVRGTAINNDGALKAGYTAPSVESQAEVIAAAQSLAEIDPATISYVEAHGTGTALGDPIEVEALGQVFGATTDRKGFCALGSVKTNIGHLDAAAGVAGLIKTVLALEHAEIPPSLGCESPNPTIGFENTPFVVNTELRPWSDEDGPRRAGVSSFGVGGTNAHVVLEEAPERTLSGPSRPWQLLPLAAATEEALARRAEELADHLEAHPELDLADVAHTLQIGRRALGHRLTVLARDLGEAVDRLRSVSKRGGHTVERERPPVAFLIPGQGAQRAAMGSRLYRDEPTFREAVDTCCDLLQPLLGRDLRELLFDDGPEAAAALEDTAIAQPALFVTAWATARLWAEWGVEPRAYLGHSLGEWVAAALAGVLSVEDALRVVVERGRRMGELPGGAMLSIPLDEATVTALLAEPSLSGEVELAAVNGDALCAVSGPEAAIARLEGRLRGRGVEARRLQTSHAFHSAVLDPMLEGFGEVLRSVRLSAPERPVVSSRTGQFLTAEQATDPDYWLDQTRLTVRFADALATLAEGQEALIALEVGPGRALAGLARRRGMVAVASLDTASHGDDLPDSVEAGDEHAALLAALATLWRRGVTVDWRGFGQHEDRRREVLPTYPFADTRYWIDRPQGSPTATGAASSEEPIDLDRPVEAPSPLPAASGGEAPQGPLETAVASLWSRLLGTPVEDRHADFFALGGHSLLATQAVSRLRDQLGVELVLDDVFRFPTPALLAERLVSQTASHDGSEEVARDDAAEDDAVTVPGAHASGSAVPPLAGLEEEPGGAHPLSTAQRRFWLLDRLAPGNPAYNIPAAVRLRGRLDVAALEGALDDLVARHGQLRTVFEVADDGEPTQRTLDRLPEDQQVVLEPVDLAAGAQELDEASRATALDDQLAELARRPFDVGRLPLLRAALVRLADDDHGLLLNLHHLVGDGWSMAILVRDLGVFYSARVDAPASELPAPELPALTTEFTTLARRQLAWLDGPEPADQLATWRRRFAGDLPVLDLPTDRPRRSDGGERPSDRLGHRLDPEAVAALRALALEAQATPFMALLAVLSVLLGRLAGQDDVVVGTPIAGRRDRASEDVVGLFLNTLALRLDLAGSPSFRQLLGWVAEVAREAYAHQDLPFERVLEALGVDRDLQRTPLFQVFFNLLSYPLSAVERPELRLEPLPPRDVGAKFDLTVYASEVDGGSSFRFDWIYDRDLFDRERIAGMARQLDLLLAQVVADPDRPIDRLSLQAVSNLPDPTAPLPAHDVPRLAGTFRRIADQQPDAEAVAQGDLLWTYGELRERVDDLAAVLRGAGVEAGDRVLVTGSPSPASVAAALAVFAADGVLVPVDPELPGERLAAMVEIATPTALLWTGPGEPPAELDALRSPAVRIDVDAEGHPPENAPRSTLSDTPPQDDAYIFFTSGSTGRPKAILGNHRGLSHFLAWQGSTFEFGPGDRMAQLTAWGFDPMIRDLFVPLTHGAAVVLPERSDRVSGAALWKWLDGRGITRMQVVPSLLESWLDQGLASNDGNGSADSPELTSLRTLFSMGEALTGALVERFRATFPRATAQVINLYGPTETTLARCWFEVPRPAPAGVQPLGFTLPDSQALVVGTEDTLCGVGEPGEIVLRTPFRSSGYLDAPDHDRDRFVPNPWRDHRDDCEIREDREVREDLVFHTGDRGRYGLDGRLEFLGRLDQQIKIRGVRVEPAEVRQALLDLPGVAQGTVRTVRDADDRPHLVAYLVPAAETDPTALEPGALRSALARRLAPAAVPERFVVLDDLPRTHSGKIDHRRLPDPGPIEAVEVAYRAPETAMEQRLAKLWQELLGDGPYGLDDDFFARGGTSLSAVQLGARLATRDGIELPLRKVFETPTLEALAATLDRLAIESARAEDRVLPIAKADEHGGYPLSFAQHRLWFLDQLSPGLSAYNIPTAWRLQGPLDVAALETALAAVVDRHSTLRTRFDAPGGVAIQVIEPTVECPLPVEAATDLDRQLAEEAARPFDLGQAPLLRARLFRRAEDDHVLTLVLHHIVGDAWSVSLLLGELGEIYAATVEGRSPRLEPLEARYVDHAAWQRRHLDGERLARSVDFWRHRLEGAPEALALPGDRPRPPVQSLRGTRIPFRTDGRQRGNPEAARIETVKIEALARSEGATPFALLFAVFQAVLQRTSGQDDFVVGTPVANRARPEVEPLIGLFLNPLPIRSQLSGDPSLRQATRRIQDEALAAYEHQELPFEKLVDELDGVRDPSHSPIFQVLFTLHNTPLPSIDLGALQLAPHPLTGDGSKLDLTLDLRLTGGALEGSLEIATALFDRVTGERLLGHFQRLLLAALAEPEVPLLDLPMLDDGERHQVLEGWNTTATDEPAVDLWQRFTERVAEHGERTALVTDEHSWAYRRLHDAANHLAGRLIDAGARPGTLVAVLLDRSPELVATLLAVLRTGAAYVPLDPAYPAGRLATMVEDSGAALLVTTRGLVTAEGLEQADGSMAEVWPADRPMIRVDGVLDTPSKEPMAVPERRLPDPAELAYVIYTSGSTGKPKGVEICHRGMVNFLAAMASAPGLGPDDRLLAVTSPSFDISVLEMFLPLWVGGQVEIADRSMAGDALRLGRRLDDPAVTVAQATPSTWRMLVDVGWRPRPGLRVLTGGEALPQDLAAALRSAGGEVWNLYGPTETTVWSTVSRVEDATPTLGGPIANTQVRVLDRRLRPVAIGAPGEVYLGGAGLARGYHDRPALTAERFLPDPYAAEPGARLYRVGDLARWRRDGHLLYLGRTDHQVKIRGFRIELGEIEAVLASHPELGEVVVHAVLAPGGGQRLVAWVTAASREESSTEEPSTEGSTAADLSAEGPSVENLRGWLGERLPGHMVPALFVAVEALPKTPNGKIDRRALEVPDGERPDLEHEYVAPQGPVEEALAKVWGGLLGVDRVGRLDGFFALGGDSILAVQMVFQAREAGYEIATAQVFQHPTLGELAAVAETLDATPEASSDAAEDDGDDGDDFGWSADEFDGILEKL